MSKRSCAIVIILVFVSAWGFCMSELDQSMTQRTCSEVAESYEMPKNHTRVKNYEDDRGIIHLGEEYEIEIKNAYIQDSVAILELEFTNNTSQYENYMMNVCCKAYQNNRQLDSSYVSVDSPDNVDQEIKDGESTQVLEKFELNGSTGDVEFHFRKGFTDADSEAVVIRYTL